MKIFDFAEHMGEIDHVIIVNMINMMTSDYHYSKMQI